MMLQKENIENVERIAENTCVLGGRCAVAVSDGRMRSKWKLTKNFHDNVFECMFSSLLIY